MMEVTRPAGETPAPVGGRSMENFLRQAKYPLIKSCDMPNDVKEEVTDICLTAVENFPSDYEKSTHNIKEALDRKLGGSWQVVAGERFSFQVTHQCKAMQYLLLQGTLGILVWKA